MEELGKISSEQPIDRRSFIQMSAAGAVAMAIPAHATPPGAKRLGIVVHSYASRWNSKAPSKKYPPFTDALQLLDHCHELGGGGVQVMVNGWTADFSKKVRERREKYGLYLEGSVAVPQKAEDISAFEQTVANAREAGATVLRTVTSSGRRYETYHSTAEVEDFKKKALQSVKWAEPVLAKYKVKLAIENHKDWLATELAPALKQLSSEWVGVTLDLGNSISLMEDPMQVIETLVPYVMSTHVKDMGVEEYKDGFLLSEVPMGTGIIDLKRVYELCLKHNPNVTFNLEMITRDPLQIPCLTDGYWASFEGVPGTTLARTIRMVKEKQKPGLPRVAQLTDDERLAIEQKNIVDCLQYARTSLEG